MAHHSPSGYQASRIMIEVDTAKRSQCAKSAGIGQNFAKVSFFAQERQIGLSRTCICQMEKNATLLEEFNARGRASRAIGEPTVFEL
jgi:hypothetical protein